MTESTLLERLDRIIDGYYRDSEDYKVIKEALSSLDKVAVHFPDLAARTSWYGGACGTDLKDVEDMPENTVNQSRCPGCGRTVEECQADDVYDDYSDLTEPMA